MLLNSEFIAELCVVAKGFGFMLSIDDFDDIVTAPGICTAGKVFEF